jgi:cell division protein FtsL
VTAPLLLQVLERRPPRALAAYAWLYGILGGAVAAVLALQVARGRSLLDLLGAYRPVVEVEYDLGSIPKWVLWHVAELDLALGFVPFAALLLLLALAPQLDARTRVFLAAATSLALWTVVGVSVFAARHALRIEERNLFYVQALFLIALVVWVDRGLPRPSAPTVAAVALAGVLPALLPFSTLITVSAVSDTLGLMPWWDFHEWGVPLDQLWIGALLAGVVAVNVAVLRLNVELDRTGRERSQLKADVAGLRAELSSSSATSRIEQVATEELGLVPADPETTTYVPLRK